MNPNDYTPEQKKSIEDRVEKARKALQDLHLQPACMPQLVNMGDDVFATKLIPYLQDTLFAPKVSPIQPDSL